MASPRRAASRTGLFVKSMWDDMLNEYVTICVIYIHTYIYDIYIYAYIYINKSRMVWFIDQWCTLTLEPTASCNVFGAGADALKDGTNVGKLSMDFLRGFGTLRKIICIAFCIAFLAFNFMLIIEIWIVWKNLGSDLVFCKIQEVLGELH